MIDKDLIQRLHEKGIIDKKLVLWWQLGFEGRRIFTEEEFRDNLRRRKFSVEVNYDGTPFDKRKEMEFDLWARKEVPILLKNITLDGIEIPCFISVRPAADSRHRYLGQNPERILLFPIDIYYEPHVRGIAIEKTDRFLFWYPILTGIRKNLYSTIGRYLENEKMWVIYEPIDPTKFQKNLIRRWNKGKIPQTKAIEYEYQKEGYEVVPYFDFDNTKKHIMVYPIQLLKDKLDSPVIIKSLPEEKKVEILGMGYISNEYKYLCYWKLPTAKRDIIKDKLKSIFNLESIVQS